MEVFVVKLVLGQCAFLRNLSFQIDAYTEPKSEAYSIHTCASCIDFTAILFVCREKGREKNGDLYKNGRRAVSVVKIK